MALAPATRLGVYQIQSAIGAGGMGEVYRARDTKLGRDVAIKVLPDAFAHDSERLARFEREARTLASLNHAHIAHVYGLEEAEGVLALVMELVEGATLADQIAHGPLPLDQSLATASQIADALEAAHERGIVHRDLKPANVKVRPDGTVKVLDFGLAKLDGRHDPGDRGVPLQPDLSLSPTTMTPAVTQAGVMLGTAAYMSPEQAKGQPADKRSDIWAFGCVLFEMLTGRRAFDGDGVSDTIAAVLRGEPDWGALPAAVPPLIRTLLQRCLSKDRAKRIGDIAAARFAIDQARVADAVAAPSNQRRPSSWSRIAAAAAGVIVAAGAAGAGVWLATPSDPPPVVRSAITATSPAADLTVDAIGHDLAISPDGRRIVYAGDNSTALVIRSLDALEPVFIRGAGLARQPFVSPDSQWVGFFEGNSSIRRVPISGGPAVTVASVDGAGARGATWGSDGTIVFATNNVENGLMRVSADGGTPSVLTKPDTERGERDHLWPEFLPSGNAVLFTVAAIRGGVDAAQVAVFDLRRNTHKVLVRGGSHARFAPTGHLVYAAGGALRAVAFDPETLEVRGAPVVVIPQVLTTPFAAADFGISSNGTLVYVAGSVEGITARALVWLDRQGRQTPIPAPPRQWGYPRLSPDGTRIAVNTNDQDVDIWLWDLERATLSRVSFDPGQETYPVWAADGRSILFSSNQAGRWDIVRRAADNTGPVESLDMRTANPTQPSGLSPDGRWLVFTDNAPTPDVMMVALAGERRVVPLVQTPAGERNGTISADGRWLAYESNESGEVQIYVRPFPDVANGHWQVSTAGGTRPLWSRRGDELFFRAPSGAVMSVAVDRGATWSSGTPVTVVSGGAAASSLAPGLAAFPGRNYDVSPDGKQFLMITAARSGESAGAPEVVLVQNWTEELKRLVPAP